LNNIVKLPKKDEIEIDIMLTTVYLMAGKYYKALFFMVEYAETKELKNDALIMTSFYAWCNLKYLL